MTKTEPSPDLVGRAELIDRIEKQVWKAEANFDDNLKAVLEEAASALVIANRAMADPQRMLWRDDVVGICQSPDMCFEYSDCVRCGPCAIKQAERHGVASDISVPNLPEVSRLNRELSALTESAEASEHKHELHLGKYPDEGLKDQVREFGENLSAFQVMKDAFTPEPSEPVASITIGTKCARCGMMAPEGLAPGYCNCPECDYTRPVNEAERIAEQALGWAKATAWLKYGIAWQHCEKITQEELLSEAALHAAILKEPQP